MDALSERLGISSDDMATLNQALIDLPTEKTITITIETEGDIPALAGGGKMGKTGLAWVNEHGSEIADIPGFGMALMTQPGPILGAFPAGTEIISHSQSMQIARDMPNIARMAGGGTIEASVVRNVTVNIGHIAIQGNMSQGRMDIPQLTDSLSRELARRLKAYL
jgi:hypothetical protein